MKNYPQNEICLGTWKMGGDISPDHNNDDQRDIHAIQYAIDRGITHIDTSESYAGGKTEKLIGLALSAFQRDKYFIATKVREYNLAYENVLQSCLSSLSRLGIASIDLYYIHKQNPDTPIEDTCEALNLLQARGIIRHIGLSNVGIDTIKRFSQYLEQPIYAVQNQYNLVCRESQYKGVIDYCKSNCIRFFAWRPILLSFPGSKDPMYHTGTYELLDRLAVKYRASNTQIVARWLIQQAGVSIVFKSSNPTHIDEILGINDFILSQDDWNNLDQNFPYKIGSGCTANTFYQLS